MKTYATWWLWARLVGWDGTPSCFDYTTCESGQTCVDGVCVGEVSSGFGTQSIPKSSSTFSTIWNWIKGIITGEAVKGITGKVVFWD